jgi:hypothetical protein
MKNENLSTDPYKFERATMLSFINSLTETSNSIREILNSASEDVCKKTITDMDFLTHTTHVMTGIQAEAALGVFGTIKYRTEQNSKQAYRVPGIIQCKNVMKNELLPLLTEYNRIKEAASAYNKELSTGPNKIDVREIKEIWQSVCSMLSLKQLFRVVHFLELDLSYCGLSIVTKPVVKKITKEEALKIIKLKKDKSPYTSDPVGFLDAMTRFELKIADASEDEFNFRLARRGAPRPVANIRSTDGYSKQVMASMPIIIFTDNFVDISLPREPTKGSGKTRSRRSDAFIDIDPAAGPQVKIVPVSKFKK